jgi:hypothetical protein
MVQHFLSKNQFVLPAYIEYRYTIYHHITYKSKALYNDYKLCQCYNHFILTILYQVEKKFFSFIIFVFIVYCPFVAVKKFQLFQL